MASVNRVTLIGTLGKDPELRHTPAGAAVTSFSMATEEKYKNKAGEQVKEVEWHNVICWNKLAEIAAEYLAKGKMVYVEGKIKTRKWNDPEKGDRYTTEIICNNLVMLSQKSQQSSGSGYGNDPGDSFNPDDDIPF